MLVLVKTEYAGNLGTEQGEIFEKDLWWWGLHDTGSEGDCCEHNNDTSVSL